MQEVYGSTFPASYLLACFVGMHCDTRVSVPEWIAERYSERVAGLSAEARKAVLASRRVGQGRVATPEFWTRWALRACRDTGHMGLWAQVAHYSPRMSLEEEILGDAGGGVVKHVLS